MTDKKKKLGVLWVNKKGDNAKPYLKGTINGVKVIGWYSDTRLAKDENGKYIMGADGKYVREPLTKYDEKTGQHTPVQIFEIFEDTPAGATPTVSTGTKFTKKSSKKQEDTPF